MKRAIIQDFLMFGLVVGILFLVDHPLVSPLVAFIIILIYTYQQGGIKIELGFERPTSFLRTIALSAGLAIVIVLTSHYLLLPAIEATTGIKHELGMFGQMKGNTSLLLISLGMGWILGGLLEETIFRAFLISRLVKHLPPRVGAIVGILFTSVIFGYLHTYQGISGQILVGFVGLFLAVIYVLNKRNIWLNIFTHGFINTISMFALYFGLM